MRAFQLATPAAIESNPLRPADLPIPQPGPGQVRIKVSICGVCHTDLHTAEAEIHPPRLPVTLGHQVVGWWRQLARLYPPIFLRKIGG